MSMVRVSDNGAVAFARESGSYAEARRDHRGFGVLAGALLWRSWRDQRNRIALLCLCAALLSGALCATVLFAPNLLTGLTHAALNRMIQAQPEIRQSGSSALVAAFILGQGPFLLGLFAATAAGNVTRSMIVYDIARGGFEMLLSSPYPARTLFGAYLFAALGMTALSWTCIALPGIGVSFAACVYARVAFGHLAGVVLLGLVTSVAMAIYASTVTMFASVKAPGLMGVQSGASSPIPQLISVIPSLVIFGLINLLPGVNLLMFASMALSASLLCACVASWALGRSFNAAQLLSSH